MHRTASPRRPPSAAPRPSPGPLVAALVAALVAGGCGWVDSTGRQAGDGRRAVEVMLDEAAPGEAISLPEDSTVRLTARSDGGVVPGQSDGDVFAWTADPLEEGALDGCAAVDGFRPELAAASFAEACTDPGDCTFAFERIETDTDTDAPDTADDPGEQVDGGTDGTGGGTDDGADDDRVRFELRVPPLKAAVGVRRELRITAADGTTSTSVYDFCLIAINEAPEALDDGPYTLGEGETLVVAAGSPESLLANDSDDIDVSNSPLSIEPVPLRAPSSSSDFSLGTDGSFRYTAREQGIIDFVNDSFDYQVTDGVFTARATVRLRVVARNRAPVLEEPLPPFEGTVGEPFEADLAAYFVDPEDGALVFSAAGEELPPSGSLTLSPDGVLGGTPLDEDIGGYDVQIVASDGERETSTRLSLDVVAAPNRPPEYVDGSIDTFALVLRGLDFELEAEFVDPDGDTLRYELIGEAPRGVEIDRDSGVLSGPARERGTFSGLRVEARDPDGETALSDEFTIRVL